jgi:hypothetical protein
VDQSHALVDMSYWNRGGRNVCPPTVQRDAMRTTSNLFGAKSSYLVNTAGSERHRPDLVREFLYHLLRLVATFVSCDPRHEHDRAIGADLIRIR